MTIGDTLRLTIDKPVAGGRMLARHEGAVVLVAGALPGEVVSATVDRVQRGTAWAHVIDVHEPSPSRVGLPNSCGGCVLAHASYAHQLEIKQQVIVDAFARIARRPVEPPEVVASPEHGYRMRARLHAGGGRLGFYREGTHELCDPASTGQLLPATLAVLGELSARLEHMDTHVTAIDLAENRDASERALHVELERAADSSTMGLLADLDGVTALSYSHEGSPRIRILAGDGRVTDRFEADGTEWCLSRSTRAFFQGNRYLVASLVDDVRARLLPGAVTDLYAGVGLFAVAAAAAGHVPVMAVEGDALSATDLRRNTSDWRGLLQARHESVEAFLQGRRLVVPRTMILDPPRTGLSRAALGGIVAAKAPRLVYVSCDVPTLARDTRALADGGYDLTALRAFDLFPNTAHVETVATFDLRG